MLHEVDLGRVVGYGGSGTEMEIDSELSDSSVNPVQNKVVKAAIDDLKLLISQAEIILKGI